MKERIEQIAEEFKDHGYHQPKDAIRMALHVGINEALELAAMECDQTAKRSARDLHGSVRCAAAIRKLKVE